MSKEFLKISEFAALSGISRKLLIFYDKIGILHPQVIDHENGYRYYSYRQIDVASVIVSLREAGMPLDDIRNYLADKSPRRLIDILGQQEDILDRQIQKLSQIKGMIRARIEQTQKGIKVDGTSIRIERQSIENCFLGTKLPDDYDLADGWTYLPEFYTECKKHNIQVGFTVGTMVTQENLEKNLWDHPSHYFYRLPNGQYPIYVTKPEGNYVVGTNYTDYGQVASLYEKLLRYIKSNNLQISGNAYEEYLIDEISENNPEHYLLQIAIQISALTTST